MKAQAITLTLIVLATVALLTPRPHHATAEAALAKPADAEPGEGLAGSEAAAAPGQTVLSRHADGHFYAEVLVGGTPVNMLVDTGASFVALTAADADALGLEWRIDEAIIVGRGASGPVRGVPLQLAEMEVGDHIVRQVPAAVIIDELSVSLLGQSFLQRIDAVRIESDRMVLGAD